MAAALSVTSDLTEIRLESELALRQIVDHHVDSAIEAVVESTIDEFGKVEDPTPEQIKAALKRSLRKAIKGPLRSALDDILWAAIQAALSPDRLGAGINLLFRAVRDALATPEGLRERAARAAHLGNEDKARELRARAEQLEEARRGNDR